ncbi:hypothetical protein [Kineosporia sp. A_224]|uniref:hypothetical protein n=1 Tax=Kineosporia sp. A_224 TaxID=1962180 RepID=UPI001179EB69|nr:hypothetical protein [Kineosporia sp. A_224]
MIVYGDDHGRMMRATGLRFSWGRALFVHFSTTGFEMAEAYKLGIFLIFTKAYRTSFFGKVYPPGSGGQITRIRKGWLTTSFDLRLKDGTFLRKVPLEYFRA